MENALNFIGGDWRPAQSGAVFRTSNPATEQIIAEVPRSDTVDVQAALDAAKNAKEGWRLMPAPRRGEILFRVAQLLTERKEALATLLTQEMGKVLPEARGDVQEAIDMAYFAAGEGRRLYGYTAPVEMPQKFGMAIRDAVGGVVALITPWNFPIAIPSWKTLPALIAGNTIVFKPASDTPALAASFVRVFQDAGLPDGVLNLVTGPGGVIGNYLADSPDVRVISFTGSTEVGYDLYSRAARTGKKVALELGGKNAVIVMDDANLDPAIEAVLWGAYGTTGQRCTATSRVIVHRAVRAKFVEMLAARVKTLKVGDGLDPVVQVGPLINNAARNTVHSYVEIGKGEGARLVTGGNAIHGTGFFYEPTLFDNVTPTMRIAQEEIFGPVLSVIEADSLEDAIQINNGVAYGLSASLFTENVNAAFRAIRDISTGIVYINHATIGAEIGFPFGGTRGTGNGSRESGLTAIETFTEWKSVYVDYSGTLQRAQIDNH
jgi:alpha-ketoglutaric semialdehyde dehydrogenase